MELSHDIEVFKVQLQQLRKAVEEGDLKIVVAILDDENFKRSFKCNKSILGEYQLNLLNTATSKYCVEIVKKLIGHGFAVNLYDKKCPVIQPLWYAMINGRDQIAKILILAGADVNRRAGDHCHFDSKGTPLQFAALNHNKNLVQLLLYHGAKINAHNSKKETALHYAVDARQRCIPTVRYLLKNGARVDAGSEPVLLWAARFGNLDLAKMFIAYGAIESNDTSGKGALHHAAKAYYQNTELAMLLIRCGIPVDKEDKWGETPLHDASKNNNEKIVKLLIAEGANVNAKCKFGVTPLFFATSRGNMGIVKQLLAKGASPNVVTKYGQTAFHLACSKGHSAIVSEILKYDTNVNIPTFMDVLAYDRKDFDWVIRKLLIKYIAKLLADDKYISEEYMVSLKIENDQLFVNCESEIRQLKATIVYNKVTFFKLLTMGKKDLIALMGNEELVKVLEETDIDSLFPLYAREISERYNEAKTKFTILSSTEETLNLIFYTVIPSQIISKLLEYLTFEEMQTLLDSK